MNSLSEKKSFLYKTAPVVFASGLAFFGLSACGEDPASPDTPSPSSDASQIPTETSSDTPLSQEKVPTSATSSSVQKTVSSSSKPTQNPVSSSSKTATASSDEVLNEPQKAVNGSCGPKTAIIEKGDMATWSFFRETGDVFDAIMAPFVWKFPELDKTVQGNGMNSVNVAYEQSGTYTATLNVDGTEIACDPLQVQGIPITINSCKADKETAKAGETITWTVEAESEATITGYSWTSTLGTISGTGTTATLSATADMHKQKVSATVAVTNNDKTTQTYACESVVVVDPEQVDYAFVLDADMIKIPTNENFVIQVPDCSDQYNGVTACTLTCDTKSTEGEKATMQVEGAECSQNDATYIQCSLKEFSGKKTSIFVKANISTIYCGVTKY